MPQSKKRPHHEPQRSQPHATPKPTAKKTNRVIWVTVIFFTLVGLGISFFTAGNIIWLVIGALLGAVGGYLVGQQINKEVSKK